MLRLDLRPLIDPPPPKPLKYTVSVFLICKESEFTKLKSIGLLTPVSKTNYNSVPLSSTGITIILLTSLNLILELFSLDKLKAPCPNVFALKKTAINKVIYLKPFVIKIHFILKIQIFIKVNNFKAFF